MKKWAQMALSHHLGPQGSVIHFHTMFSTSASCAGLDIALSHRAHDIIQVCMLISWTLL